MAPETAAARETLIQQSVAAALPILRRGQPGICVSPQSGNAAQHGRDLADLDESDRASRKPRLCRCGAITSATLDDELIARAAPIFTRLVLEQLLDRATIIDPAVADFKEAYAKVRAAGLQAATRPHQPTAGGPPPRRRPPSQPRAHSSSPSPRLDAIQAELSRSFSRRLLLWKVERDELAAFGGELDPRSRCRAGPTSGRCRFKTGSTCSPPASTRRSASACSGATSTT